MEDEKRHIRKLSDLSLIDDYLFGLFIQEAGSEEILKELLECMLDIKITKVNIKHKQHEVTSEPNLQGIRLDAFVQDDKETLYDIEVQTVNRNNLPKRMRYYQSLIDREQMPSGKYDYDKLPKTIIIFVTDFDLFNKGLYRYTFENICKEDNSLTLGDESLKVVLNTKGKAQKGVKTELIELLEYFHSSTEEMAEKSTSSIVKKIDKMLKPIKNSPKFGGDFMSYEEKIYTERSEARQEGRQEGRKEGEIIGTKKERTEIIEQLKAAGVDESIIKQIRDRR